MADDDFKVNVNALHFPPPHDRTIPVKPVLYNQTRDDATFKIKTTTPDRYSVKPRMGRIRAGGKLEINISYRPQDLNAKQPKESDKFQLEVRHLSPDERAQLDAAEESSEADLVGPMWKQARPSRKFVLKCCFDELPPPADASRGAPDAAGMVTARPAAADSGRMAAELREVKEKARVVNEEIGTMLTQIDVQKNAVQKDTSGMKMRISVPLWFAIPLLALAAFLGHLFNTRIHDLAQLPSMRQAALLIDEYAPKA